MDEPLFWGLPVWGRAPAGTPARLGDSGEAESRPCHPGLTEAVVKEALGDLDAHGGGGCLYRTHSPARLPSVGERGRELAGKLGCRDRNPT